MSEIIEMTADIISAYLQNNKVGPADVPELIKTVWGALSGTAPAPAPEPDRPIPAVPVRKSVQPDYIICLEDGRRFKSMKRHLRSKYGLSPAEYRERWGLPKDSPMVAPTYAAARSALAKAAGLGMGGRKAAKAKAKPAPKSAPKTRGRPPKAISPATVVQVAELGE